MFPASLPIRLPTAPAPSLGLARPAQLSTSGLGAALRLGGLAALLSAALSAGASAQSTGTMQVTARVLPAGPSWTAVDETYAAVRRLAAAPYSGISVRRAGLVRTEAVLLPADGRRLVVTIQHPYN
jgi:hypothetical protein